MRYGRKTKVAKSTDEIREKTVDDFGEQWSHFTQSEGLYGDPKFLEDLGPLVKIEDIKEKIFLILEVVLEELWKCFCEMERLMCMVWSHQKALFLRWKTTLKIITIIWGLTFLEISPTNLDLDMITDGMTAQAYH